MSEEEEDCILVGSGDWYERLLLSTCVNHHENLWNDEKIVSWLVEMPSTDHHLSISLARQAWQILCSIGG